MNLSGSFVRILVRGWLLVVYNLSDDLSGQIQFVRVFFSLKHVCSCCFSMMKVRIFYK